MTRIRAEEIQKGDTIELPCNDPGVQWRIEGQGIEAPLRSAGRAVVHRRASRLDAWQPLGDLYTFTVKEVGAGAEVDLKIRGHVPVRRYR